VLRQRAPELSLVMEMNHCFGHYDLRLQQAAFQIRRINFLGVKDSIVLYIRPSMQHHLLHAPSDRELNESL
jgi:hypothetical protein